MYEAKRREFFKELQHREESMRQMFVNKVKETEAELKEKEKEVRNEHVTRHVTNKRRSWVCLTLSFLFFCSSASREIRSAEAHAPGRKEESGGEKARTGRRDECFQQEEGGS